MSEMMIKKLKSNSLNLICSSCAARAAMQGKLQSAMTKFFFFLLCGAALVAIGAVLLSIWTWMTKSREVTSEPPPVIESLQKSPSLGSEWKVSMPSIHRDDSGREATIQFLLLSADYQWQFGDEQNVESHGKQVNMMPHLMSPGIGQLLRNAKAIITVGVASEEGDFQQENIRANRRGLVVARWIKEAQPITQPIFSLNMGKFVGERIRGAHDSTAPQRTVAIILVIEAEDGVDLKQALRSTLRPMEHDPALTGKSNKFPFPFKIADYASFDLNQVR